MNFKLSEIPSQACAAAYINRRKEALKRYIAAVFAIGSLLFIFGSVCLFAADLSAKPIAIPPPPMGWSSWNSFSNTVDANVIMQQTKALAASGMQKAGYRYINIDEGWWLGERDAKGNIVVEAKRWPALMPGETPGDMSNIVKYIHGSGLKAGIYTDAGADGCSYYGPDIGPREPHTGSEGHYDQDFLQFAQWGFDYVKVDWCGGNKENLDPAVQYAAIARAIQRAERITGHSLYFSICNWGKNSPWTWAPGIGDIDADIWRTSGDIVAPIVANSPNSTRAASFPGVLSNFDQGIHPEAQHTGFYNDPDMMVVGMQGLSEAQNRVHMSLWAISGAPLIAGADLTKLSDAVIGILTNPEVIAVDQDSLGIHAVKVDEPTPGLQVWAKLLAQNGARAVVLLNRTSSPARISVDWRKIGLMSSSAATVRDLWTARDLGEQASSYSATVPAQDAAMILIHGQEAPATVYEAAAKGNEFAGGASPAGRASVLISNGKSLTFHGVKSSAGPAFVTVRYVNRSETPVLAELRMNGQTATKVAFPPTKGQGPGEITLEANLAADQANNALEFSAPCRQELALVSISVSAW